MDEMEKRIFDKKRIVFPKLEEYGFVKQDDGYVYERKTTDGNFKMVVKVSLGGEVSGKVYDLDFGDEYTNFRLEENYGSFVGKIKGEFESLLMDIADKCTKKTWFSLPQTNRICDLIFERYAEEPRFEWEGDEDNAVFKNHRNEKWYGIIISVLWDRLVPGKEGKTEVINVKLDPEEIPSIVGTKGIFSAFHMNKQHWVSIVLDGTLSDDEVMSFVSKSYDIVDQRRSLGKKAWIAPANPKFYDVMGAFEGNDYGTWKQGPGMDVGDIVYLYVGAPISCVMFKLEIMEKDIPFEYADENVRLKHLIGVKVLKRYERGQIPFSKLGELGILAVRGPRRITEEFEKFALSL